MALPHSHGYHFQKSDKSTGIAFLKNNMWLASWTFPKEPPNTTYPSGVFLATTSPVCLVWPVCMWTWSIPNRSFSTSDLPVWEPQELSDLWSWNWHYVISDVRDSKGFEYYLWLSTELTGTRYPFVLMVSPCPPTFIIVTKVSLPLSPSSSAVFDQIRLIWMPESRKIFPYFCIPFCRKCLPTLLGEECLAQTKQLLLLFWSRCLCITY